ncbi:MAG TPA: phosphoenolpyruvate synthase [bacterium]|nr:phosphoenolpyruvate synthase [bacterium]
MGPSQDAYIRWFDAIGLGDIPLVGGKTASLGEMVRALAPKGIRVPEGFAVTAEAYRALLAESGIEAKMRETLSGLKPGNVADLARRGEKIRSLVLEAPLPRGLETQIRAAYARLRGKDENAAVAVRSSATAEDLPDASFAGQQETFLNVRGESALIDACRRCFASLFTNRAISYRIDKGFDHLQVALSVAVQKMVRSDLAASGVMFTIDTESGFDGAVLITSSYGLGENIVQGTVNPDEFLVFKPTLAQGFRPILQKTLGSKEMKLVYNARGGTKETRNVPVPPSDRRRFSISDDEILQLARWGIAIEEHYGRKAGRPLPMDIEWAKDGESGELFILQARPETVQAVKDRNVLETYRLVEKGPVLATGQAVGSKIGAGRARLIRDAKDIARFREGEVLVTEMTDPDWEPVMKKAAAVVTERGGRTCHAAIVSRELGVPAVVGAEGVLEEIAEGREVTVSCAEGEAGRVYEGRLKFDVQTVSLKGLKKPGTPILMNVGEPDRAFGLSRIPNDGVGLARMEFIITNAIKIHPMALIRYPDLKDRDAVRKIGELTRHYQNKKDFFVDRLAQGAAKIAAAFYPKEVILRTSDFKTNEYANLIGGREFEPEEENPMIGFRGASRYYDPRYREGFALECAAVKKAREEMGLANLKVMIPFCRTVEEARKVLEEMEKNGLKRGEKGLEVYMMCEIPSNALLASDFARHFDGFSIGSNDLTQLVLGLDRDSRIVAGLFDERNEAVKKMIALAIRGAHEARAKIGICGQAPSDYPEFARFLAEEGIDSISLNPDAVLKTMMTLAAGPGPHDENQAATRRGSLGLQDEEAKMGEREPAEYEDGD